LLRHRIYIYASLLAVVVLFFHKPLFSSHYSFPWDFPNVQLPLITFLRDELAHHRFATWNPYNYAGYPIFANIQACFFHPLVFASAWISSRLTWYSLPILLEWTVVLQVWIGGVAAWHLFRALGLGSASAWAGAVMFETGSYFASRAEHIDSMMAAAWMPLAWLVVWHLRHKLRLDWLIALAAILGMSIWGGFPQATVAVFGSTLIFAALLAALRMARAKTILGVIAACAVAILLAAAPFIPTTQLTGLSVAKYRADWLGTGGGLYWQSLVSLVWPDYYHIFDLRRFDGPWDPSFLYLYSSIGGLLLAIFALVLLAARRANRTMGLFALMLAFAMFWMLGDKTPVWRALFPLLPEKIRIGIHPEYTYCIFSLSIAGLAAAGLNHLRIPNWARWAVAVAIAADLFLVGSGRPMNVSDNPGVTRDAFAGNHAVVGDLRGYVQDNTPPWRFDTVDTLREWTYGAPILQLPAAAGISPMAPENAIQLRLFLHDGFRWGWDYPLEHIDSPIVDLLNVRYILTREPDVARLRKVAKLAYVADLPGHVLFENKNVFPRFFLVHDLRTATTLDDQRRWLARPDIDLRHTAIVETPLSLPPGDSGSYTDDVQTLLYSTQAIELATQSARGSLLVLSETYYPGWKAWVDGRPTPIYETDIALRGVLIPPGAHHIRMEFRPVILPISIGISLATAISLAISAFFYRRRAFQSG